MDSLGLWRRKLAHCRSNGLRAAGAYRSILLSCGVAACLSADPALAQSKSEVRRQQEMMIWTTDYEGLIDGRAGAGTIAAIKKFQTRLGHPATGRLTSEEEEELLQQGSSKKARAGFKQVVDHVAGISVGVPLGFVSSPTRTKWGQHWYSRTAGLAIDTLRLVQDVSLRQLYDRLLNINDRRVSYQRFVDDNWFVIAAFERDAAVYVRANLVWISNQQPEIRGFSIWMSKDRPPDYDAIPPAMLSSFRTTPTMPPETPTPIATRPMPTTTTPIGGPTIPVNPPIRTDGPARSLGECYRGLGECPPVLTFR